MPIFGCVADDFTGASDAASSLVKGGMSVQLFNGIPAKGSRIAEGVQAIVIALKSRTQDTEEAVADTLRSLGWLKEQGVERFYLKYCSTFGWARAPFPRVNAYWLPFRSPVTRAFGGNPPPSMA